MGKDPWRGILTTQRRVMILQHAARIARLYGYPDDFYREWCGGAEKHQALALLMGGLIARCFQRHELMQALGVSNGKIAQHSARYDSLPDILKHAATCLSGELAPTMLAEIRNDDAC
jgi:hypothetical protein